ncbi:DUF5063 domain-containing protein [Tenacibaculum sp. M341]|uniref:DUF5063 domain-containing protein n=1 Tax=Tenacibaculum sp. M341 TaxID=2530339 RepID=UPI0010513986|nr:DUF5063 domain-containing protein [Tenacibaculum sp. M341]TCI90756.1 DUF5063 domain-containing protein [Tenacibaculum sp. M341]
MDESILKKYIDEIVEFGLKPSINLYDDNVLRLKSLLINIYAIFIDIKVEVDDNEYEVDFNYLYEDVRKNVESNFPKLTYYTTVIDCHKVEYKTNSSSNLDIDFLLGDSIDDISDIIKDLLEVKWRFENTSNTDAIWHFNFLMNTHSEQHLVDLLKYLKGFKG